MKGTLVNVGAILAGSAVGMLLKRGIPARFEQTLMQGMALAIGFIGAQMALKTENPLIMILSIAGGGVLGEALRIDDGLQYLGKWLNQRCGSRYGNIGQGFITASLVYCIGAMAIVGAIQEGMTGEASTLYAKSLLDGITSVVFTSTMGIGVALSSITVLLYQGGLTILANIGSQWIGNAMIREMTAVGGLLIVGISLLILELKTIKIANLLPAIPLAALLVRFWPL